VQQDLPDVRSKLEKIADEVTKDLEKISKKESIFKTRHDEQTGDYKEIASEMKENTEEFNRLTNRVKELESELYDIDEKLDEIKKSEQGSDKISDTSPLLKIKKAITKVKNDIRSIDIRIGVVSNTILQNKLKERNNDDSNNTKINAEDDDLELEL
jgi:estrogen-related receptor beta like 1